MEGKLNGKISDINITKIKNTGYELGYSYISINRSKLSDKNTEAQFEDLKKRGTFFYRIRIS
jgi:hypothetical protein